MAGQRYGWQDCLGGVEPGFADVRASQATTGPADDDGDIPAAVTDPGAAAHEQEWMRPLME